jgi:hypothetical protein
MDKIDKLIEESFNLLEEMRAIDKRKMALKAGIIPQTGTNWQGALREMRTGRGELKTPKEMNQIKQKMGVPSNNAIQDIKKYQRKAGDREIGLYDNRPLSNKSAVLMGTRNGVGSNSASMQAKYDLHTHPDVAPGAISKERLNLYKNKENPDDKVRLYTGYASTPSGTLHPSDLDTDTRNYLTGMFNTNFPKFASLNSPYHVNIDKKDDKKNHMFELSGDMGFFHDRNVKNGVDIIHAPAEGTTSIVKKGKMRPEVMKSTKIPELSPEAAKLYNPNRAIMDYQDDFKN